MRDLIAEERVYSAALDKLLSRFSEGAREQLTTLIAEKGAVLRDAVLASPKWTRGESLDADAGVVAREVFKLGLGDLGLNLSERDCLGIRAVPGQPFFAVNLGSDYGALELLEEVNKWANAAEVVAVVVAVRMADGSTELRWSKGDEDRALAMIDCLHAGARKIFFG